MPNKVPDYAVRFNSKEEAIASSEEWGSLIHSIRHIIQIDQGSWTFMGHINCEECEFCGSPEVPNTRFCTSIAELQDGSRETAN